MTQKQIQVGIVGASAQKSWAHLSHVPAINGLTGLKLAAVATRNEQSARKSAEAFGADRWFSDPLAMINDDQIDLITISVKVFDRYCEPDVLRLRDVPVPQPQDGEVSDDRQWQSENWSSRWPSFPVDRGPDS